MKFKIVFYLFLFVCVILFFQLINTNKILNHQDRLIQNQNSLQLQLKDSIASLKQTLSLQKYFSVDEKQSAELKTLKTELMAFNVARGFRGIGKQSS
jgi:predicted PurR-regulated permease PerM